MRVPARSGALLVFATLVASAPALAQVETPTFCPETVDPSRIGYPNHVIDYSDGDDSGNFLVLQLWDPNLLRYGPRTSVSYRLLPEVPWDVNNIRKEWRQAAIDADCFWLTIFPDQWLIVQERFKYGIIEIVDDSECGHGGPGGEIDQQPVSADLGAASYDPYEPGGGCGDGGLTGGVDGGGGAICGGDQDLYYEYVCIDVRDLDTGLWVEVWCGVVAVCR